LGKEKDPLARAFRSACAYVRGVGTGNLNSLQQSTNNKASTATSDIGGETAQGGEGIGRPWSKASLKRKKSPQRSHGTKCSPGNWMGNSASPPGKKIQKTFVGKI